jgi:hypothetical protein
MLASAKALCESSWQYGCFWVPQSLTRRVWLRAGYVPQCEAILSYLTLVDMVQPYVDACQRWRQLLSATVTVLPPRLGAKALGHALVQHGASGGGAAPGMASAAAETRS